MNNKGVTLIELLIVIVVLGIISAFAIPAVGTIIDNTEKDSVVADAIAIENAAKLYCAQTTCSDTQTLTWINGGTDELKAYVTSFDASKYEATDGDTTNDNTTMASLSGGVWTITLTGNSGELQWPASTISTSSTTNRANVTTAP